MASYLARLAAANHVPVAVILACLPKWFTERAGAHDDLAGLAGSSPYGIACLAALTGISATALGRALPAFAARPYPGRPVIRAAAACRRCCAQRGAAGPIPVHLPACQRICERHQIWLGASRQINVAAVPQIARACRRAAQLCDRYGTIQYLFAETTARQQTAGSQDRARNGHTARAILTLAAANPGTPHDHPDLLGAAGYPPVAATAASILRQQPITPRGPDSLAKPAAGMAPGQVHWQSGGRPSAT
jgi:hypothetical protein